MTYKLTLIIGETELVALIRFAQLVDARQEVPNTSLNIPGEKAEKNKLLRFSGQNKSYVIRSMLYNDGVDISDGSAPTPDFSSGVVTLFEQIRYWEDYMQNPSFGASYKLEGPTIKSGGVDVDLRLVNAPLDVNRPNEVSLTIELDVGEVLV